MSVFSFSKTERVWGLRRSTTMCMIEWWIEQAGPKEYLLRIRESYEHGYNHGDLTEVADEDKAELRDLVRLMLETDYQDSLQNESEARSEIRRYIVELLGLLNADLEGTRFLSTA